MRLIEHTPKKWAEFIRTRSPIAESIVPLNPNGRLAWFSMGNDLLLSHANWVISEQGFEGRVDLKKGDSRLYEALRRRNLLDCLGFEQKRRYWTAMDDEELIRFAESIKSKKGIDGKTELKKADPSLYQTLRKRKLLKKIGFEGRLRHWSVMSDEELVRFAKELIAQEKIGGRKFFQETHYKLYAALYRRKLLEEIGLGDSRGERRNWAAMGDVELVEFAKAFIAERGIKGRRKLKKADLGLYSTLRKRKLLDEIGLEGMLRNWAGMSDDELVGFAKGFIAEKGIESRTKLARADRKLYEALTRRKLLDDVFSDVESSKHKEAVQGVLDALESFGDDP